MKKIIASLLMVFGNHALADTCITGKSTAELLKTYPSVVSGKVLDVIRGKNDVLILKISILKNEGKNINKQTLSSEVGDYNSYSTSHLLGGTYTFPLTADKNGKYKIVGQPNACPPLPAL